MKELIVGVLELLVYLLAAVAFTAGGLFAEWISLGHLVDGNVVFAIWLGFMGAVALYVGIVALGAQEVLPRIRQGFDVDARAVPEAESEE